VERKAVHLRKEDMRREYRKGSGQEIAPRNTPPSNLLPSARTNFLKFPKLPKTVPPAGK
jgi:hypothetical protein